MKSIAVVTVILSIFITEYDESWISSLKQLLVPCLTSQLRLTLAPAEWAAILCGVGGAEDLEELNVTMKLTAVSLAIFHHVLISIHLNIITKKLFSRTYVVLSTVADIVGDRKLV